MKNKWSRTTFRIRKVDHQKLREMSDRAGYKIKEFLDEIIKRQAVSGIWEKGEGEIPEVYKDCLRLTGSSRVTFEISDEAMSVINQIAEDHKDLNRDQILSIMIFTSGYIFGFPLRLERKRLKKLKPLVKRIVGLSRTLDRELQKGFAVGHSIYGIIDWNGFLESTKRLDGATEAWSRDVISPGDQFKKGRSL